MIQKEYGWYCPICDAIYFNPDDDSEHEAQHESIDVIGYEWLKRWIKDAEEFGLRPDEIVTALLNYFKVE
jgi:hypothetical protein